MPRYSPAVFLRFAAGLDSAFFATRIGTTSSAGAPQPSFAGILGCLYVYRPAALPCGCIPVGIQVEMSRHWREPCPRAR